MALQSPSRIDHSAGVIDPSSAATVASLTMALVKAWIDDDFELDDDGWAALRQFVSSAPKLVEMFGERPDEQLAARVTMLGIEAFREALRQHWGGSKLAVPDRVRFWQRWSQRFERAKEIESCIQTAFDELARTVPSGDLARRPLPELLFREPESLPLYLALLRAFDEHGRDLELPLLSLEGGGRLEFDRQFRAAWKQLLTQKAGGELLRWLDEGADDLRRDSVRDLLLGNLSAWSSGHVFAAAEEVPELPWMPPEDFYIEPRGFCESSKEEGPLIAAIEAALERELVVFVTADFGYGKSLTARTLAAKWAREYLRDQGSGARPAMPIYIACGALDWGGEAMTIDALIRSAWMHQIEAITGEKLADDDEGLAPPGPRDQTLMILDGLDEAQLDARELDNLLSRIRRATASHGRHFVLFFRPGLLSSLRREKGIELVRILPFNDMEIERWVWRWNFIVEGPTLTVAALAPIRELASVPILLFMIAYQWSHGREAEIADRHSLYEGFAATLARGKLDATGERSERIVATARAMATRLRPRLALLRQADSRAAKTSDEILALLWLMGRIAWMGYRTHVGPELGISEWDIDQVLRDDLEVEGADVGFHRVSLLTCMQGRLEGDASQRYVFFGHRSFHEFFVARFWRDTLVEIASARGEDEVRLVERLLDGELIPEYGVDDQSLSFLFDFLKRLDGVRRRGIARWAHDVARGRVYDERLKANWRWHVVQLVALAVACELNPVTELTSDELRAILTPMWIYSRWRRLSAPGLSSPRCDLSLTFLSGADLRRADLEEATLVFAALRETDLSGANLRNAMLKDSSSMHGGKDSSQGSLLLDGADLSGAQISRIALRFGIDEGVTAHRMICTQITVMEWMSGSFREAGFNECLFIGVRAKGDFSEVLFAECVFVACDFSEAMIQSAQFFRCIHNDTTWPPGFDAAKKLSLGHGQIGPLAPRLMPTPAEPERDRSTDPPDEDDLMED
jgi:uncharacterized protein YjbI with pentapeptide repeats